MENFSFLPYLLLIIGILAGVAGLTFLIIGLINSKRKLWLPGAIILSSATIIGIFGFVFFIKTFVTNIKDNIEKFDNMKKHNSYVCSDSTTYDDRPVDSTFAEPISGFIEDSDNSMVYVKVFPSRNILPFGITLEKVDKGKKSATVHKAISLIMSFDRAYNGKLRLTAFDYEKKELGSSGASADKKSGEISSVNFAFPEDVNFSVIDYCTLTVE
jgi:hypothetical protein